MQPQGSTESRIQQRSLRDAAQCGTNVGGVLSKSRGAAPGAWDQRSRIPANRRINEFSVVRCFRDDAVVLLSVTKPAHWATATDERRDKVVVAAIGESALRFWRIPRENRLRREIIELLRPLEWRPG